MMSFNVLLLAVVAVTRSFGEYFLEVDKTNKVFTLNGKEVFLSGANEPWFGYGQDFGNDQSNGVFCTLNDSLYNVSSAFGNTIRYWLFAEGQYIPEFDSNGNCIGTDGKNSMVHDLGLYLDDAAKNNVLVVISLWNGAMPFRDGLNGMVTNVSKTQSFINNALIPLVSGLKNKTALAAWELMNEPEGAISFKSTNDRCTNTSWLQGSGADWTNMNIDIINFQRFFNLLSSAIHNEDPKALVTIGGWCEKTTTDAFGYTNYFSDECLINAGGKQNGIQDFIQFHTYAQDNGKYNIHAPFHQKASDYQCNLPLVIGEFDKEMGQGMNSVEQFEYIYGNGYNGAWEWGLDPGNNCGGCDGVTQCMMGMGCLWGKPNITIEVSGGNDINISPRCWCSDNPPDSQYTCAQQASWGKCNDSWMNGYCCKSCDSCQGCQ